MGRWSACPVKWLTFLGRDGLMGWHWCSSLEFIEHTCTLLPLTLCKGRLQASLQCLRPP